MTMMPPISSTTAKVVRKIFRLRGMRFPSKDNTPNEKAISVAIGMAAPRLAGPSGQIREKMRMGTSIPPQAATTGSKALRGEESSPTRISRLISRPTEKKKIAISASLIRDMKVIFPPWT